MYNERKDTFSIRDIIIQVLCVLLFVFLLLWLFPTKSFVKKNANNNGATIIEQNSTEQIYDALFNYNVQTMKETAISYYTTSRLPSKVGDTSSMTLRKMLEEKLILPFVDSENKECDLDSSYVQITKDKDEYLLKVSLVCPSSKSDYIIVHLGCYDYCKGNICEKKEEKTVVEKQKVVKKEEPKKEETHKYEYVKVTKGSCTWSGWSDWSTTAIAKSSNVEVETKTEKVTSNTTETYYDVKPLISETVYSTLTPTCKNGTLTDGNTKCVVYTNAIVQEKVVESTPVCSSGTLTDGNKNCIIYKSNDVVVASKSPKCSSGYSYDASKSLCIKDTGIDAIATTTGGSSYWTTPVRTIYSSAKTSTSTTKYSNPSVVYGIDNCNGCKYKVNYIYDVSTLKTTAGKTTYSCKNSNYLLLSDNKCHYTKEVNWNTTYKCKTSGYTYDSANNTCYIKKTSECSIGSKSSDGTKCSYIDASKKTCSSGSLDSSTGKCYVKEDSVCSLGYTKTNNGSVCTSTGTSTHCPSGYSYRQATNDCVSNTASTKTVAKDSNITKYRSRTQTCTKDVTETKYSTSKSDTTLIKSGYTLVKEV